MSATTANGVSASSSTVDQLRAQWTNPSDVLSVLLIIGGDIIQKAIAQTSGGFFSPVCFSFGWVGYSLTALVGIVGDGRLLPPPDHPAKVFNLKNGYARENKNWIIGRLLRDNEISMARSHPLQGRALRIAVFEALPRKRGASIAGFGRSRYIAVLVILCQFGIATIPTALYGDWGVLMIVGIGTLLAALAGSLPQWAAEKLPSRQRSWKNFAITSGNGSRDIMIVLGNGNSLDLEELATSETPRSTRPWESSKLLAKPVLELGKPKLHDNKTPVRKPLAWRGIPVGFWITMVFCVIQCICWFCLLITVAGIRNHMWYLLLVGCLGMFQNAAIAAVSRVPEKCCLPLKLVDTIITRKVMDGLMDLEFTYGGPGRPFAWHLLKEFFPGDLEPDEKAWWNGDRTQYDLKRHEDRRRRGPPRSKIGKLRSISSISSSLSSLSDKVSSQSKLPKSSGITTIPKIMTEMDESRFTPPPTSNAGRRLTKTMSLPRMSPSASKPKHLSWSPSGARDLNAADSMRAMPNHPEEPTQAQALQEGKTPRGPEQGITVQEGVSARDYTEKSSGSDTPASFDGPWELQNVSDPEKGYNFATSPDWA